MVNNLRLFICYHNEKPPRLFAQRGASIIAAENEQRAEELYIIEESPFGERPNEIEEINLAEEGVHYAYYD